MGGGIDKRIGMTAGTVVGAAGGYDTAVIRSIGRIMDGLPGCPVTAGAIAAGSKVLGIGAIDGNQAAVGIMTGATGVMGVGCRAHQGIVMAVGTVSGANLDQTAVIRGNGRMGGCPTQSMTGFTVAGS